MATVRVKFNKSAEWTLWYGFSHRRDDDPVDANGCARTEKGALQDFEAVRETFSSTQKANEVTHVIQSWSPDESKTLTREQINQMGFELASRYFPGHQFVVVTHTDRPHFHNHIVVNSVNYETGKRIQNKFKHWKNLSLINDEICRERGLSVPNGERRERALRMSDKVRHMLKHHRFSFIFDMTQKADLARSYATSYAEYAGILTELNVGVRIEDKNITYFYGKSTRGVRGKQLGTAYGKDGLEARFKTNDERFQAVPKLRERLRSAIDTVKDSPLSMEDVASRLRRDTAGTVDVILRKDYARYPRQPRREGKRLEVGDHELQGSVIPIGEIRRARQSSIIDYCRTKGIGLVKNESGDLTLKGRDYVVVRDREWINRKNRTSGSLIEFVAVHQNMTFLQSVAHINNSPRLLLLEELFGENRRKFTPFYVPKADQANRPEALKKIGELLASFRLDSHHAEALYRSQQVHVSNAGVIRFFGKDSGEGALEFVQDDAGQWSKKVQGRAPSPFAQASGSGKTAKLFADPFTYLKKEGWHIRDGKKRDQGILALLTPDSAVVGAFLAQNPHINRLELVSESAHRPSAHELDFFNNLKARYRPFGVEIELVGFDHRSRGRGPEISF